MVATAENTQMRIWRSTAADWAAVNPVIADGEFVWSSDVKVLKIGDGVSTYNALPKLYDGTLEFSDLTSAVDAALAAVDDAQDAATNASQSNANTIGYTQQALDASTAALANQQLARDYAVGPPGTVLPTGGDSAAVSAGKAASTAEETRFIPIHPTPMTANATFAAGDLFQERDCTAAGLVTLTIPAGIFASADQKKAWALLRLRTATGSLKVQGSTGSDLQAPPIKKTGFFGFRNPTIPGTGATIVGTAGAIPAITAGRLLLIVDGLWNVSSGNTLTVSSDSGLTWTARRAQPDPATPNMVPSWSVFDAPLTAFAGGDVVITLDPGLNGQFVGCYWIALEGTVAGAPSIAIPSSFSVASFCEATLAGLAASSRVLAVAAQRGGNTSSAFTSFGTNITKISSGNTAGMPEYAVSDANNSKNQNWGLGQGVPSVTGDFTVRADFTAAYDEPSMILVAYAPKTVVGGGDVVLELQGGRDTLTEDYGEMMLKFLPDGKTVQVLTTA